MTVKFIEGFDFGTNNGENLPGQQDYGYFYISPSQIADFTDGYLTGQACQNTQLEQVAMRGGIWTSANTTERTATAIRVYWVARLIGTGASLNNPYIGSVMVRRNDEYVGVAINSSGDVELAEGGFFPGPTTLNPTDAVNTVIDTSLVGITTDWMRFEMFLDFETNEVEVYMNGGLAMNGTIPVDMTSTTEKPAVYINNPDDKNLIIDHIVVTDGPQVAENAVAAVAVGAAWNHVTGANAGLQGNLVINGVSYKSSDDTTSAGVPNSKEHACPAMYFLYPTNPATGAAWTDDPMSELQGWGVCSTRMDPGELGEQTGASIKVTSVGFCVIETLTLGDHPIIRVYEPSYITHWSGDWRRTDQNKGLAYHVKDIPRTDDLVDDEWVTIDENGCIIFQNTTEGPLFYDVGVTFAEEYRIDYKDFLLPLGDGDDFESYFVSGYSVLGDGNKDFQSNYVTVNYEAHVDGSAYLQGVWDYATSGDSGRWSSRQQIYNHKENFKHLIRRLKVRGRGKAMQVRVTSEEGKPFFINGWSVQATSNAGV